MDARKHLLDTLATEDGEGTSDHSSLRAKPERKVKSVSSGDEKLTLLASVEDSSIDSSDSDDPDHEGKKSVQSSYTICLLAAAISAALGSGAVVGYAVAVLNNPRLVIISDLQHGSKCSNSFKESDVSSKSNFLFEFAASVLPLGNFAGSVFAGMLADRLGRRNTLLLNNFLVVPLTLLFLSADSFAMLIAGRVILGISSGVAMVAAIAYINEISPVSKRGALGLITSLSIVIAIFLSTLLGLPKIWGNCANWHILITFPVLFSAAQTIGLIFSPQSPRYLYLHRNDKAAARRALQRLRGSDDVREDIRDIKSEKRELMGMQKVSTLALLSEPNLRWQLAIALMLHLVPALSGVGGVFFYGRTIFESAGVENAALVNLLPAAWQIILGGISTLLVDRVGRRALVLNGLGLTVFSYLVLSMGFCFREKGASWPGIFIITGALGIVTGYGIGLGMVLFLLTAELFPQESRAAATSLASAVDYLANYFAMQTYLILLRNTQPYGMLTFAILNSIFWLFFYIHLPETSGLTTSEIQAHFKSLSDTH